MTTLGRDLIKWSTKYPQKMQLKYEPDQVKKYKTGKNSPFSIIQERFQV